MPLPATSQSYGSPPPRAHARCLFRIWLNPPTTEVLASTASSDPPSGTACAMSSAVFIQESGGTARRFGSRRTLCTCSTYSSVRPATINTCGRIAFWFLSAFVNNLFITIISYILPLKYKAFSDSLNSGAFVLVVVKPLPLLSNQSVINCPSASVVLF